MRSFLLLAALSVSATALAAPTVFNHQGSIHDSAGNPLEGMHSVSFSIYDAPTSGSSVWTETLSLSFEHGYFNATLGKTNPLDPAAFHSTDSLFLAIAVDGGPEMPTRIGLASVPWALSADTAMNVSGGTVDATSVAISGTQVIGTDAMIDYSRISNVPEVPDALGELGCANGQVVGFAGGAPACVDPLTSSAVDSAVSAHAGDAAAHHARYADSEAVAAMGAKNNGNALNHDRYANSDAVAAMGAKNNGNALNHDRYADSDAVAAMGAKNNGNALNHDRYTDANAVAAVAADGRYGTVAFSASDTRGDWVSCSFGDSLASGKVVMNKVDVNIGGGYDPNTGSFRAPTAGAYMICLNFLHGSAGDDYINFRLKVNDSFANGGGNDHFLYEEQDHASGWKFMHACQIVQVNANDQIQIQAYGCQGVYESADNNHERLYGFRL